MGQPLYVKQVAEAIRPLVSDLLDDEGEDERTRACAYLISNDSAGKQQWPALYEQAGPAPCDRIVDDDHAFVAAAIRTALGLPAPRPPLPASARLAPWVDTEREARALCHADRFEGHCGTVSHIIISQDGARAVTSGSVGGPDLWDVAGRRRIRSLTSASDQSPLGFVAETGNIVTQLPFGGLFVFEPRHGRFLLKTEYCESSTQAGKTGGGAYRVRTAGVAALSADGSVGATTGSATCIWDTRDGRQVARFDPCGSGADGTPPPEPEPAPLPGGAMMPYGYPPPYQRQMLLQSQMQLRARLVQRPVAYPSAVALSVDGSTLAVGCVQHIRWFDSKTGAPLGQVAIGEGSAVGRLLVLGHRADLRIVSAEVPLEGANSPAEVRVWSAARRRIESTIPIGPAGQNLGFVMHGTKDWGRASLLAASPDGSRILLVANPRTCVWDLAGGERIHCLTSPENAPIAAVAWSPEGSFVMGADQEVSGYTPDAGPSRRGLQVWPASELVKSP
jgi:WD40 repeat protein